MKNNKTIVLSILISCILVFISCSGLSEKTEVNHSKEFAVSGSINIEKEARSALRAAYPSFDFDEDISWTVVAKNDNPLFPDVIADCKENASFSVVLTTEGKWSFYAMGKINGKVILQNTSPVEVTAKKVEGAWVLEPSRLTISVYPVFLETESGSVKLYFRSSTREYRLGSIKYDFTDQAVESGRITFNDNGIAEFSLENVPAGMHNVKFTFFEEERERELYSFTETLIVFSGVQTDTWQETNSESDNPDEIDYSIREITDELIFAYEPNEVFQIPDNPIILWNYSTFKEPNTGEGSWSNRTGHFILTQISENQTVDEGILFGKNVKDFFFDGKNDNIYATEYVDSQYYLYTYPSAVGFESGNFISTGISESLGCIYDGNIWLVSKKYGHFSISKLENGKPKTYSLYAEDASQIELPSDSYQSLTLCADENYLYALYSIPDSHQYEQYDYRLYYFTDYTLIFRKFAISENDKKLTCLAELSVKLTEDFGMPAPTLEHESIVSNFSVNDIMLVKESQNNNSIYVLIADGLNRGGIAKFVSSVTDNTHSLVLSQIDESPDAPILFGWWYENSISEDVAQLKSIAADLDSKDYYLHFASTYNNVFPKSSKIPYSLSDLGEATVSSEDRTRWEDPENDIDGAEMDSLLESLNEKLTSIRNAVRDTKIMTGPLKFIARKPDELIIAEDTGCDYDTNRNSVYSLNLRTLTVTRTIVQVSFDGHMSSGWHTDH